MTEEQALNHFQILDLDLDFFVSPTRTSSIGENGGRPDPSYYKPWPVNAVRNFLEKHLNLSTHRRTPGMVFETHDQIFGFFTSSKCLLNNRRTNLVHVDAHADLGMGSCCYTYIFEELLHLPVLERRKPRRGGWDGLSEGTILPFLIANQWINSIEFVSPPQWDEPPHQDDIPHYWFRNGDITSGVIELRAVPPGSCVRNLHKIENIPALHYEPPVAFRRTPSPEYHADQQFDMVFLIRSPSYAPKTADPLIPIIQEYLELIQQPVI
jgi:hypothetical protein